MEEPTQDCLKVMWGTRVGLQRDGFLGKPSARASRLISDHIAIISTFQDNSGFSQGFASMDIKSSADWMAFRGGADASITIGITTPLCNTWNYKESFGTREQNLWVMRWIMRIRSVVKH